MITVSNKLDLIDKIGRALQSKYTFDQLEEFFAACGITPPARTNLTYNSKWRYSRLALQKADTGTILSIAKELDINVPLGSMSASAAPRNWKDTSKFRLFISHISKHKDRAMRLKECLDPYGISGFVSHQDIQPTLEWQLEIERALNFMDAFIAIHTPGFSNSVWTQQEIGFALGRGVKVISFRMGEDPTGFISKHQALSRGGRTGEQIAHEIDKLLSTDEATAEKLVAAKKAMAPDEETPF